MSGHSARTFRSDNNAGLCPEALDALARADDGHVIGYGDDALTQRAVDAFKELFGDEIAVYFVATGTAANCLAIASLTRQWQQVVCHAHSHYNDDESTAPERFTQCRTVPIHASSSRLCPADIEPILAGTRGDVHQPQPGVLTISNTTEFSEVYTPAEVFALSEAAHGGGFRVHMDGARFANAVAALDVQPRALTADAGIDAMSFGGTKNGLAFGEAVVFFPQGDGRAFEEATSSFEYHRKSMGHLLSKHRFVAAPFAATLRDGIWLRHAAQANSMASLLADGLAQRGLRFRYPVQANGVFVEFSDQLHAALERAGHGYYQFGPPSWKTYRLMCSFDTTRADVKSFLDAIDSLM